MIPHLFDNGMHICGPKELLEVVCFGCFAFGYVGEDVADLEHIIEIRLYSVPPLLNLVLVTCDLG